MAKHQSKQRSQQQVSSTETKVAGKSFQMQLQELLNQKKYRQALEEIKKNQRSHPDIEFTPKESEIWLLRGQQEFQKQDFKQAEKSFARALESGLVGEVHYWQAKCLLELKQLDAALKLLRNAFEAGNLPKEYSICYLKLLLLKGDTATVEQLIEEQSKRFSANQLHWVRGVLALKNGQAETALTSFMKIKRAVTDGDLPIAWIVYTQQVSGNWDAAAHLLGLKSLSYGQPKYLEHPILERLAVFQQGKTEQKPFQSLNSRTTVDKNSQEALTVLRMLQLIDQGDHHEAAHLLLKIERRSPRFPELESLRPLLLTLAGQQALNQGEPSCAELFWQPLLTEQPFNPQLAINLLEVFDANDNDQERPRLLTRFLKWLEQEAKQKPQEWTAQRLKATQAHLHCWMADAYMAIDRSRAALGSVQQAERICPTSPEVLGRKGLIEAAEDNYTEAIALLTQALESGCRYEEVYGMLLHCWKRLDNKQAFNEARRKFGKHFGDVNIETEVETLPWIDALSTLSYPLFSRFVEAEDPKDPAIRACQIFVNSVQSPPNSGGRVSLDQKAAAQVWDTLLKRLAGEEQIAVLQAIALSIQLFAKREKGIAALISQYQQKLINLSIEYPEARVANLVILAVKENSPKKLEIPVRFYLDTMPQPGNALANIQLQARRFGEITTLVPFLDEALRREPQNPLLLLARATTYDVDHPNYEQLKQQGFELARRLQDAKALQAFREEQAFLNNRETQSVMPDPEQFDNLDMSDMDDLLSGMLKKLLGNKMSKAEFERMLPELKQMMLNRMPDFSDDEDEDEDEEDDEIDLDFLFRNSSSTSKKRKGRKKAGFQELL
ncbi:tetratricopeptide repeat protein [Anabaena cylindrica FACHB-243]|uniref:Tetratricopeptide TPR_1 repeat-containing protein n=1 Tax=Anabaena cylindrica (strain ATCC 27899 / PCC 7122) TaxID=272123 RepID=K9ZHN6_ANACC|nr:MULTISPECIES: tetratricopeptide repeat protein [Anabaena]AFZ58691.1 Tetratricopeptide TPR_1 repeat-containing protein [Anabaena cylindrica PCC 7122]MBD2420035.1 tetratricopeptide repeat protein [Anabaena cylindrica FACHB-243]MBY5282994.1 tetratricopeptide repeat protein [Anabaena sp. CCAP 1446/1C]MBY5306507.1 tetratricopeptide repeat protein [Anabaena sp. CCAP 1446/1C]MCM2407070.1 tetratricopeptide repeat protein [Anabaena sp. CCAP 1446/1C]